VTHVRRLIVAAAPFLFAVGGVLYLATDMAAPAGAYVRPLLAALAIAGVSLIVALVLTRSINWASVLSSAFVLFTFRLVIPALVLFVIAVWWVAVGAARRAADRPAPDPEIPRQLSVLTTLAALALVAFTGWTTVTALAGPAPAFRVPEYRMSGTGGPNVYVILLDGYPRSDTLSETFGYDNGAFLEELEERGFDVSSEARSNYPKTWTTLASAFNGEYVDRMLPDDEPIPVNPPDQIRWLSRLIDEAAILDVMRERGYTIRTIPSLFVTTALATADDYRDAGHLTEVEMKLITRSPWTMLARNQVADFLLSDHRAAVEDALEATAALAEERDEGPQLVFSHVASPHTPFVLGADGTKAREAPACFPLDCTLWHPTTEDLHMDFADFRDGLTRQIGELDEMVLDTVGRIVAADPDAIVVVMSDHGIRYSRDEVPEHYRSFLAARTPDGAALFADDESPVNVFRKIAAYAGAELDPLPYERWGGIWDTYLHLELLDRG
jgi:hypothetical protein